MGVQQVITVGGMSMKVYKKDIYSFLERVEAKAIASVRKKYQEHINDSKRLRSKDFTNRKNQITLKLELALVELEELWDNNTELQFINYSDFITGNRELTTAIRYLNKSGCDDIKPNLYEQQLIKEREQLLSDVMKEYARLNAYCKENKAIDSYNMLVELGFDVSSIPTSDHQVVAKVDKSKLFVCGERS